MKRFLFSVLACILSVAMYAQKDVTKFLGIPIDGTKSAMIEKLKAKGFKSKNASYPDILVGEFNGKDVNIHIGTNGNKVWRIMVCDENNVDEGNIRINFNRLCSQFKKNPNYVSLADYTIQEDEKISYEMTVNSKKYDAIFYQAINISDTLGLQTAFREQLLKEYSQEQLEAMLNNKEQKEKIMSKAYEFGMEMLFNKSVWFRIMEDYGKYYIAIFYDNEYNRANGEDL